MQAPGPGTWHFIRGVQRQGLLAYAGEAWREYGDVFQVRVAGRKLFFVFHPDGVAHVNQTGKDRYQKLATYESVRKFILGDGLVASNGEHWRRQRRLLAPFFTPKAIRAYGDIMIRDGENLRARWEQLAAEGTEVEMDAEMAHITASIILKALFSTEAPESLLGMKEAVETMVSFASSRVDGNALPLPLWMPTARNRNYRKSRELTHNYIDSLIAERRAQDPAEWPPDLLACLMNVVDPETGSRMDDGLVRDEAITAFFAGYETTARTLTFAWYALAANPEVAGRLHAELDAVLGHRTPTVEDLRALPYTLNVIKEVLRLYPAAPFYARDAVEADTVCGYDVPAGATVMLSPYYTHRHAGFWDSPEQFAPERWSDEGAMHAHAYHPFATGPRICIGNNLSLLESHILLAMLAQRFVPRLREGFEPQWVMRGVLSLASGLPMVIEPRGRAPWESDTRKISAVGLANAGGGVAS